MKRALGAADKAMRILGPKDKTLLERKNRQEFQLFMARRFAPYAHFRRSRDTGAYFSHSVDVAWQIWGAAQHSPHRPLLATAGTSKSKSKGARRSKTAPDRASVTRKA